MYIRYGIGVVCGKVNDLKKKKTLSLIRSLFSRMQAYLLMMCVEINNLSPKNKINIYIYIYTHTHM